MIFLHSGSKQNTLRDAITCAYRSDETARVNDLLKEAAFSETALQHIHEKAKQLVQQTRQHRKKRGNIDTFLHEYDLSSDEGIALMCLSEALLRIPDRATIDRLISDKISSADWKEHLNKNHSLFVNAATWSLMLTGKVFSPALQTEKTLTNTLKQLMGRAGGAFIRPIILQGMKIIGKQFVMGTTIDEALKRAQQKEGEGYRYSYDMLGEAARTHEDAEKYFQSYLNAITAIGKAATGLAPIDRPGISVKLSALHPRYEWAQYDRTMTELTPKLLTLTHAAKKEQIGLTIDAEEADRLDLSLDIFETIYRDDRLQGYEGFGLVVQAYQKRASFVIDWLIDLTRQHQRRIMLRLVKGAYWDSEIKQSQLLGLEGYPVFTRKNSTDVSYIACAKKLLAHPDCFYPQFGSHNAHTVATILEMVGTRKDFEFQCLHGMGEELYTPLVAEKIPCRIYAPVGTHKDLLGYLVRRLLENGANTSFINHIADEKTPIEHIIFDPIARIQALDHKPHPHIPLPRYIYDEVSEDCVNVQRLNSKGFDLSNIKVLHDLKQAMDQADKQEWTAGPIIAGDLITRGTKQAVLSPCDIHRIVGQSYTAEESDIEEALTQATHAAKSWAFTSVEERAHCLDKAADLFENNMPSLIMLLCREGGKQIVDCLSEVRETIDFCRYYAARARKDLLPQPLKSPTGEFDQLTLHPRGIIICISPWNFPLAIFAGQVLAALVIGNTVIAKPAEQTPLIAAEAVRLLHAAGIPSNALQLLPGDGAIVGARLTADPRIAGVMFTGSTETAKLIQQTLANRKGPIIPFIAETGGQNCMIVDSSALPEQVVMDVIQSSFNSAGQRCSALRVLFIQEDIADSIITMLKGAMAELSVGDPSLLSTDIGPVIDQEALNMLEKHALRMLQDASLLYQVKIDHIKQGYFFAPRVFELKRLSLLEREVFGPILHVIRYAAKDLDRVLTDIINTGYGLTLGIHSRIDATVNYIIKHMPVGNVYVNRNMIGAVVGVQPFGGEHLSGTGPKAGGPHYLPRLCVERALSINTTAAGGNATLVSLSEDD
jgi:RHH-type transcriptional regulator, proline utilization regulon repressor / proline dehydrogenase / delta 1-pyrroline-5-carboxylate dehydrogenase